MEPKLNTLVVLAVLLSSVAASVMTDAEVAQVVGGICSSNHHCRTNCCIQQRNGIGTCVQYATLGQICGYGLVGESKANFHICSNCDSQCCCGQYCCPAADCSNFLQLDPHICTSCQSGCCCNDRLNDDCCPMAYCLNEKSSKESQIQTGRACATCQSGCCCGQSCCLSSNCAGSSIGFPCQQCLSGCCCDQLCCAYSFCGQPTNVRSSPWLQIAPSQYGFGGFTYGPMSQSQSELSRNVLPAVGIYDHRALNYRTAQPVRLGYFCLQCTTGCCCQYGCCGFNYCN